MARSGRRQSPPRLGEWSARVHEHDRERKGFVGWQVGGECSFQSEWSGVDDHKVLTESEKRRVLWTRYWPASGGERERKPIA
eukprot:1436568-Pleurochrysis_carterae.AAC.1